MDEAETIEHFVTGVATRSGAEGTAEVGNGGRTEPCDGIAALSPGVVAVAARLVSFVKSEGWGGVAVGSDAFDAA